MIDPAEILSQHFPRDLLNLDVPPPGTPAGGFGPLHAILTKAGQVIANFQADALLAQAQLSVQQAAGPYLDAHAIFYGTQRLPSEIGNDNALRARLLTIIEAGKLTIPAIKATVQGYYATATYPHAVSVFDLQSNPTAAAAVVYVDPTGATVIGLVKLDFVVEIVTTVPISLAFFANESCAGDNSYVISSTPAVTIAPQDARLVAEVLRVKAGGTFPIYSFVLVLAAQ